MLKYIEFRVTFIAYFFFKQIVIANFHQPPYTLYKHIFKNPRLNHKSNFIFYSQ